MGSLNIVIYGEKHSYQIAFRVYVHLFILCVHMQLEACECDLNRELMSFYMWGCGRPQYALYLV